MPVPSRKVNSHVFVLQVLILPLSTIFLLDFVTVPTDCVMFFVFNFIIKDYSTD